MSKLRYYTEEFEYFPQLFFSSHFVQSRKQKNFLADFTPKPRNFQLLEPVERIQDLGGGKGKEEFRICVDPGWLGHSGTEATWNGSFIFSVY